MDTRDKLIVADLWDADDPRDPTLDINAALEVASALARIIHEGSRLLAVVCRFGPDPSVASSFGGDYVPVRADDGQGMPPEAPSAGLSSALPSLVT